MKRFSQSNDVLHCIGNHPTDRRARKGSVPSHFISTKLKISERSNSVSNLNQVSKEMRSKIREILEFLRTASVPKSEKKYPGKIPEKTKHMKLIPAADYYNMIYFISEIILTTDYLHMICNTARPSPADGPKNIIEICRLIKYKGSYLNKDFLILPFEFYSFPTSIGLLHDFVGIGKHVLSIWAPKPSSEVELKFPLQLLLPLHQARMQARANPDDERFNVLEREALAAMAKLFFTKHPDKIGMNDKPGRSIQFTFPSVSL